MKASFSSCRPEVTRSQLFIRQRRLPLPTSTLYSSNSFRVTSSASVRTLTSMKLDWLGTYSSPISSNWLAK